MTADVTLIAAFMTGLIGSVHCTGMCGGIIGALSTGLPENTRRHYWRILPYLLLYNTGRLGSYTVAGIIAAWLGTGASSLFTDNVQQWGVWLGGLFMIALGLYISGWWQILTVLEKAGGHVWKYLQPVGQKLLPVKSPVHALGLGIIWGWLPCGLVYAMLTLALATQNAIQGGLLMLAFGLGTLPTLIAMGTFTSKLAQWVKLPLIRQLAGSIIILFGVYSLLAPTAHEHHTHNSEHHSINMQQR